MRLWSVLLVSLLCACGDDAPPDVYAATFEVSSTVVLISVVADQTTTATVTIEAADGSLSRSEPPIILDGSTGFTGVVTIEGLEPATRYRYSVDPTLEPRTYELTTAPLDTAESPVRFLFGADIDLDPEFRSDILGSMIATQADFFVSMGDFPYADNAPGAQTLEEYRQRHRELRVAPVIQDLARALPWYAIYDDHEMRNNWDAMFRVTEAARINAALEVWDDYFPLATPPGIRYRSWKWGRAVELFMLDTRLYRSANLDPDSPAKTMLGSAQKQWLFDGLASSTATFKIIITTVPLVASDPADGWDAFPTERGELIASIVDSGIPGVVFLTGDRHWFSAHHLASGLKEFQVGPIARGLPELPPAHPVEVARSLEYNFGLVELEISPAPVLLVHVLHESGAEIYVERIEAGLGTVRVDSAPGGRPFRVTGAHTFTGVTPAIFDYAVPGSYTLTYTDGGAPPTLASGTLADAGELVLGM
jgi:alkaline phosphatase D